MPGYNRFLRSGFVLNHQIVILLARSKSGERYYKKGHYSLLGGEYQPSWVLENNRTSLRKSNSPTLSLCGPTRERTVLFWYRQQNRKYDHVTESTHSTHPHYPG